MWAARDMLLSLYDDNPTEALLLWVIQIEHWTRQHSALTWDDRRLVVFNMSHNTNSETQQQWLIHTVGMLFLYFCISFLSPTPFLDSTASFKLPCVSASMLRCLLKSVPLSQCLSVSLHIHVSLNLFLLFIVHMWFYVFVFSCTGPS